MTKRLNRSEGNSVSFGGIGSVESHFQTHELFKEQSSWSLRRAFLLLVGTLAALVGMAGCSGYTTKTNASASTPVISLTITQIPPNYLIVGNSVPLSAIVRNDPADAGVDWVAVCGSAPLCGSFSPAHTISGGTTIFTAPTEVPAQNTVAVTALSTTNHGEQLASYVTVISGVTSVTITQPPPASVPSGVIITLAATVIGDPANLGVGWKATCGTTGVLRTPVDCVPPGLHSNSGGSITFAVPSPLQVPNIVGSTVIVTAFAIADHNFSSKALFTVTLPPTVSLTQVPPSTILTNATAIVAAVVANDTTNSGVTWSVGCESAPCGSISPGHAASGETVTFTAPPSVPAGNPVVVITASSTAVGPLVSATANVTIVAPISVNITQPVPTGSIAQNTTASLIATVTNDPGNAGVDWTVSCASPGACGVFSPTHTASGAATTFTAPNVVPAGNSVTITATSTTDSNQSDKETVAVTAGTPPNSLLIGKFVVLLSAKNSSNGPYALGGVISGDGIGHITKGSLDLADASGNASGGVSILPSTYSIGADGRGQIQLLINNGALNQSFGANINGSNGLILSVVFVTPQHALLSETDGFGSATGTLDLQNAADLALFESGSWHNGIYSLELTGTEASAPYPSYSAASAVTLDFSTSSYSYITDQSDKGVITSRPFTTTSRNFIVTRDLNGQLTFTNPINLGLPTQFSLDAWLIDANHFVVTDWRDSFSGTPNIIVGGYLTAQPSSPSVSGTYAFTEAGATTSAQPQVAGGILTCGSTGTLDVTPLNGTALSNQPISATCTPSANGRNLIGISGAATTGISQFAAYPTLDQGLYLIELDGGSAGTSGPSGIGVALQQTLVAPVPSTAFSGKYASNFFASTALGSQNFTGQIISDGASTLTGTADVNSFNATSAPPAGTPSSSAILAGSFIGSPGGRFPLMLSISPATGQPTPEFTTLHSACYLVDASTCLLLGLDTTASGTGVLRLQNTGL